MKNGTGKKESMRTELVFILDKSGSMGGLEKDTIGGFNSLIRKQKKEKGTARVTTVLFDDRYQLLHDRFDLSEVSELTEKEYFVEGSTALLDAMGRTIKKIRAVRKNSRKDRRSDKVLFVIITDGMENASRSYGYDRIRGMVEKQREKGWEFLFLGANIDAVETAARYGIQADRAADYCPDGAGTRLNYDVVSEAVSAVRGRKKLSSAWKERIEEDYKSRSMG